MLSSDIAAYTNRINALAGRHHHAPGASRSGCSRPRRQAASSWPSIQGELRAERLRLTRLQGPPGRGAARARRRAWCELYKADQPGHRHRRAQVQRLRRTCSSAPSSCSRDLRPGRADHRPRQDAKAQTRRRPPKRLARLEKRRRRRSPRAIAAAARRGRPRSRASSSSASRSRQRARADKATRARAARAPSRHTSRTTSPRCRRQQAQIAARSRAAAARAAAPRPGRRPDPPGLGRPDLAGQRPDHLAVLRVARVGVLPPGHRHRRPGRHADPRRRGRHASC